jgi:hypothetical protein
MEDVSDDALVDRGVDSESGLAEIEAEVSRLPPEVVAAARGLRRSAAKLVVNIARDRGYCAGATDVCHQRRVDARYSPSP